MNNYFNLTEETKKRLEAAGTKPNKLRGQNFLIDDGDLEKISEELSDSVGENVLEIGPGVGNLTDKLLEAGAEITAVEIDESFANYLADRYKNGVTVIHSDILHFNESQMKKPYLVVGNIPYFITGKILRKFLESANQPQKIVLTIQKEVAERISKIAPEASLISNVAHLFADVKIAAHIPREHFWPVPKVDSAVIVITPQSSVNEIENGLIHFIKKGFAQPRKTLKNNLKNALGVDNKELDVFFESRNFSETVRPHELTLEDWKDMFKQFSSKKGSESQPS